MIHSRRRCRSSSARECLASRALVMNCYVHDRVPAVGPVRIVSEGRMPRMHRPRGATARLPNMQREPHRHGFRVPLGRDCRLVAAAAYLCGSRSGDNAPEGCEGCHRDRQYRGWSVRTRRSVVRSHHGLRVIDGRHCDPAAFEFLRRWLGFMNVPPNCQ